jgi:hypothetical protein
MYVRLKHKLRVRRILRAASADIGRRADEWSAKIARAAMHNDYSVVVASHSTTTTVATMCTLI